MSIEDVVVVATVREEIWSQRPFVDTVGTECRIKAAQARMLDANGVSDDVTLVRSESESSKEAMNEGVIMTGIDAKADCYNVVEEVPEVIPSKADSFNVAEEVAVAASEAVDMRGSDEHLVRTAADSTAEFPIQKPGKRMKKGRKKKTSARHETRDNSGVNKAESEVIPGEDEAECAADKAEEGHGGEISPTHPYLVNPGSVYGRDIPVSGQPAMGRRTWPWLAYR